MHVTVAGLSRGCGASTVARGLALELAGAAVVEGDRPPRAGALVVVAGTDAVPVLAGMVVERLAGSARAVVLVANRPPDPQEWGGAGAICLPQSRLGVALVARGRRPWGPFGAALRRVADGTARAAATGGTLGEPCPAESAASRS